MPIAVRAATILTFTACREIRRLPGSNPLEYVLIGPTINWWSNDYPARVDLGLYIEFTGAQGAYTPRIELHDSEGDSLGCLVEGGPFLSNDPTRLHTIVLEQRSFNVPSPGLYDLVLFFNGEELVRRQLWVRPQGQ